MLKLTGNQTVRFKKPVSIISTASIVGPKEGEGPLCKYFDVVLEDVLAGEESWEKAESKIVKETLELAVKKADMKMTDMNYLITGDLLSQNMGSTFGIRETNLPYFGIYGACSTMAEAMTLGAILIDGDFAEHVLIGASSHFCAAEKQFRFPLALGNQRPPTSTWTVTGDGAAVLGSNGNGPYITAATTGKIVDMGIKDANNMGAAMAPAAADTLLAHFRDLNIGPEEYDLIITGDLGYVGHELVVELMQQQGYDMTKNYTDCGIQIFNKETQDTHSGGSGCACSAVTFAGYLYQQMQEGKLNKLLFIPTGALLSTISSQQGESIPSIAHAVRIETSFHSKEAK